MKLFLGILVAVILVGCDSRDEDGRRIAEFGYFEDTRVDMCFASGFNSIANVPCTEEVKLLVVNDNELKYYLDLQTNLCFATGYESIAHVECTSKVKKLIGE